MTAGRVKRSRYIFNQSPIHAGLKVNPAMANGRNVLQQSPGGPTGERNFNYVHGGRTKKEKLRRRLEKRLFRLLHSWRKPIQIDLGKSRKELRAVPNTSHTAINRQRTLENIARLKVPGLELIGQAGGDIEPSRKCDLAAIGSEQARTGGRRTTF